MNVNPVAGSNNQGFFGTRRAFFGKAGGDVLKVALGSTVALSVFPQTVSASPFEGIDLNGEFQVVPRGRRQKPIVYLWLEGGLSQTDTWSPLPNAPREIKGPFNTIQTSVPGVTLSEKLPLAARHMHQMILMRNISHGDPNHGTATNLMFTGKSNQVGTSRQNPSFAVKLGNHHNREVPLGYITFNADPGNGFLYPGIGQNDSLYLRQPNSSSNEIEALNRGNSPYPSPSGNDFDAARHANRRVLLRELNRHSPDTTETRRWDMLNDRADSVINGRIREAFDLGRVPDRIRDRYGKTPFGNAALITVRLVRAGAPFVLLNKLGWDNHSNLEGELNNKMPELDKIIHLLFEELGDTAIIAIGSEFGRKPVMDDGGGTGRNHWPHASALVIGGAGIEHRLVDSLDNRGVITGQKYPGELAMPSVAYAAGYAFRVKRDQTVTEVEVPHYPVLDR